MGASKNASPPQHVMKPSFQTFEQTTRMGYACDTGANKGPLLASELAGFISCHIKLFMRLLRILLAAQDRPKGSSVRRTTLSADNVHERESAVSKSLLRRRYLVGKLRQESTYPWPRPSSPYILSKVTSSPDTLFRVLDQSESPPEARSGVLSSHSIALDPCAQSWTSGEP